MNADPEHFYVDTGYRDPLGPVEYATTDDFEDYEVERRAHRRRMSPGEIAFWSSLGRWGGNA